MPPQNFAAYRQTELDNQRIGSFAQIQAVPFMSNRFALKRFLGLSDEDVAENERLWREENDETMQPPAGDAAGEMRSVGISSAGISADIAGAEDQASVEEGGAEGAPAEGTPPDTATGDAGAVPQGATDTPPA